MVEYTDTDPWIKHLRFSPIVVNALEVVVEKLRVWEEEVPVTDANTWVAGDAPL